MDWRPWLALCPTCMDRKCGLKNYFWALHSQNWCELLLCDGLMAVISDPGLLKKCIYSSMTARGKANLVWKLLCKPGTDHKKKLKQNNTHDGDVEMCTIWSASLRLGKNPNGITSLPKKQEYAVVFSHLFPVVFVPFYNSCMGRYTEKIVRHIYRFSPNPYSSLSCKRESGENNTKATSAETRRRIGICERSDRKASPTFPKSLPRPPSGGLQEPTGGGNVGAKGLDAR